MKTCTKCMEVKDFSEFHKRAKAKDGHQTWCKACNTAARMDAYRNSPKNREATRESAIAGKRRNRDYVIEYLKSNSCVDCGESDIIVLQFDHVRGSKAENIATMINGSWGISRLQQEIDKCEVVCANCHMRRTAKQFGWFKLTV